jgi:hypothetical protein
MAPPTAASPSQDSGRSEARKTQTRLVIHIPRRSKRAHYVSASTQSAALLIAPGTGCTGCSPQATIAFGLTPSSPGCSPSASGTQCTIALTLAPGTYVASMTTYDGPLKGGVVSGAVLSDNQSFPITILAGKANAPGVTLYGIPQGLHVVSLGSPAFVNGSAIGSPELDILGAGATGSFMVNATDQDQNDILGAGAPTIASVSDPGGYAVSIKGNVLSITSPATVSSTVTYVQYTLSSPVCAQTGVTCVLGTNLGFQSVLAVVNGSADTVEILAAATKQTNPLIQTISSGLSNPQDVKFDLSGDLFIADDVVGAGKVTEYKPPYNAAPAATMTTGTNGPFALSVAPNGDVAVANSQTPTVLVFAPPFNGAPKSIAFAANAVAFDASSNLWIATPTHGLKRYSASSSYATNDTTITDHVVTPYSISIDNNGYLYVADNGAGQVYRYEPPYSALSGSVAAYANAGGVGHVDVIGGNGEILACAAGNNLLISPGLNQTTQLNPILGTSPANCRGTFDENAFLWISDYSDNQIFGDVGVYGGSPGKVTSITGPGAIDTYPGAFIGQ